MDILITDKKIDQGKLVSLCKQWSGEMVKVVVDIEKKKIGIGGGLHADAEDLMIQSGSLQEHLWGANVYPNRLPEKRIEFTAFINIRPNQDNPSMVILNQEIRNKVEAVIKELVISDEESFV